MSNHSNNTAEVVADRSGDRRFPIKAILLALVAMSLAVLIAAALLKFLVAERIPELTEERLEAAQAQWEKKGPAGYDMDLEIRGAQPGVVHIEVRDGAVTAMTRDGRSPPERTWEVWSVPGQFDTLGRELELAEDPQHEMDVAAGTKLQLRCEFDAQFGFPRRYHRFATGGAPEVYWRITHFEPHK